MQHVARTPILEARVRAAWQEQVAAAVKTPGLLPDLVHRRAELLPRFAAYYTQLQALPRRVRRALQRQWRQSLAAMALLLALGQSPALAATIPVAAGLGNAQPQTYPSRPVNLIVPFPAGGSTDWKRRAGWRGPSRAPATTTAPWSSS